MDNNDRSYFNFGAIRSPYWPSIVAQPEILNGGARNVHGFHISFFLFCSVPRTGGLGDRDVDCIIPSRVFSCLSHIEIPTFHQQLEYKTISFTNIFTMGCLPFQMGGLPIIFLFLRVIFIISRMGGSWTQKPSLTTPLIVSKFQWLKSTQLMLERLASDLIQIHIISDQLSDNIPVHRINTFHQFSIKMSLIIITHR